MKKFFGIFVLFVVAMVFYPVAGFASETSSTTSSSGGGSAEDPTKTKDQQALTTTPKEGKSPKGDWITEQLLMKKEMAKDDIELVFGKGMAADYVRLMRAMAQDAAAIQKEKKVAAFLNELNGMDANQAPAPQK